MGEELQSSNNLNFILRGRKPLIVTQLTEDRLGHLPSDSIYGHLRVKIHKGLLITLKNPCTSLDGRIISLEMTYQFYC